MVVAILTGHAPVRGHLYIMGLFDGDPTCRFCRMETETVQHIICCCKALAQSYNVFAKLTVEPRDISTASVRDLCLYKRHGVIESVLNECLGPYSKPKAEVHLGHKLTGPNEEEEKGNCHNFVIHLAYLSHFYFAEASSKRLNTSRTPKCGLDQTLAFLLLSTSFSK